MLKIILNDGIEISVLDGSTLFDIMVSSDKYESMWENFTKSNLKLVKLVSESGDLLDQRCDLVVDNEYSLKEKEIVICHFYLREKNEVELLREQVAVLTAQLSVHDGAINDLGEAVSGLAEEGGLM